MGTPKTSKGVAGRKAAKAKTADAPQEKRGQQKQVSSPKATGNRGVNFEHRVQAMRLLAMCLETACPGVPDGYRITKLWFQARPWGHNTDDLVLTVEAPTGAEATVRMQMKSTLAAKSKNKAFEEAVGGAWLDFNQTSFQRGRDVSLIIYGAPSGSEMEGAVEVARLANRSSDGNGWHFRVHEEGVSNDANRTAFAAISAAADLYNKAPVALGELHQFLIHLKFLQHDLDSDTTVEVALQKQLLSFIGVPLEQVAASWAHLISICVDLNSTGGDIDLQSVPRQIGEQLNGFFQQARALRRQLAAPRITVSIPLGSPTVSFVATTSAVQPVQAPAAQAYLESAPSTRESSPNKQASRQLDAIEALRKEGRYGDALERLEVLEADLSEFDEHQRALWHWQRGICRWHRDDDFSGAADDFLVAAELVDDEEKIAAGSIQAHMLRNEIAQAVELAERARQKFPNSIHVWAAAANARSLAGHVLTPDDIPAEFAEKSVAWQVLATSQDRAGDVEGAFESAQFSTTKPDATFFGKEAMLRFALSLASKDGLTLGYRMPAGPERAKLVAAIDAFADRPKSLWAVQSSTTLLAAVTHLGFAYLLTGRGQDAMELIEEAASHGVTGPSTQRVQLEAMRDLGKLQEILSVFGAALPTLTNDALVSYAQTALEVGDEAAMKAAIEQGNARAETPDGERLKETLRLAYWESLIGKRLLPELQAEVDRAGITPESSSVPDLVFAVRASKLLKRDEQAREKMLDRVEALSRATNERPDAFVGAKLLFKFGRLHAAAEIYARILPIGAFSELHAELLYCYIRTGQRAKARELLQTMSAAWKEDGDARGMALELAQTTSDWALVGDLAEIEIFNEPRQARGWMLRFIAAINQEKDNVSALVGEIPEELEVSVQDVARLASAEMRYGHPEKGLRRIYRARRANMGDVEAAALHLTSILLSDPYVPPLQVEVDIAGPGVSVVLEATDGAQRHVTFDPTDITGLPVTEEFVPADHKLANSLFGRRVGDSVTIGQTFTADRSYCIVRLTSAQGRLLETSQQAVSTSITPTKYMATMSLPSQPDGGLDFSEIQQQLEEQRDFTYKILELYQQHPAPLGIIAKRLNRDVIDLVRGWPNVGPKLEVCTGPVTLGIEEADVLLGPGTSLVVDLSALTELASLGQLSALARLNRAFVATSTYDAVMRKLESDSVFKTSGTMYTHEGRLGFAESTEAEWRREREFLQGIAKAIKDHCQVMPAYGPAEVDEQLHRFRGVLSSLEYDTLLLCLENRSGLLTLDDRYRKVAAIFGVRSIWPQEVLRHMRDLGFLKPRDYSVAAITSLIRRRTFVSLHDDDLLFMMDQGDLWTTAGVNALREYLVDPILNFQSAAPVVVGFIGRMYRRGACAFGVCLELIEYLAEPLLRNPARPDGWLPDLSEALCDALSLGKGEREWRRLVYQASRKAAERARKPVVPVTVRARVLYCMLIPCFINGPEARDADQGSRPASSTEVGGAQGAATQAQAQSPKQPEI